MDFLDLLEDEQLQYLEALIERITLLPPKCG